MPTQPAGPPPIDAFVQQAADEKQLLQKELADLRQNLHNQKAHYQQLAWDAQAKHDQHMQHLLQAQAQKAMHQQLFALVGCAEL